MHTTTAEIRNADCGTQESAVPTFTSTNHARDFGRAATPEQVTALGQQIRELRQSYFFSGRTIEEKFTVAFQLQFCREAVEEAARAGIAACQSSANSEAIAA